MSYICLSIKEESILVQCIFLNQEWVLHFVKTFLVSTEIIIYFSLAIKSIFFIGLYSLMSYLEFWHPYLKIRLLKLSFYILCDLDISVILASIKKTESFLFFLCSGARMLEHPCGKSGFGTYLWQFSHISLIFILKKYLIKSFLSTEVNCGKLYFLLQPIHFI